VEYVNTIRDLLGLEIDGESLLPTDDSGYGFDNNAETLSITPAVLERYVSAATKVSRLAVGDPEIRPAIQRYRVSPFLRHTARMSEDLPFGTHGGAALHHTFPLDGEYEVRVRLQRGAVNSITGFITGLERRQDLEVRLDGALVVSWPIGGEMPDAGYDSGISVDPSDAPALRRRAYLQNADDRLRVRVAVKAGTRTLGIAFLSGTPGYVEDVAPAGDAKIDTIEIAGPYNATVPEDTPSRRRIFACRPSGALDATQCARRILLNLAAAAYRRPVSDADIQPLLAFFEEDRRVAGFEAGIEAALERLLISPEFLFRTERSPSGATAGSVFRISDVELASRLSFFLWSSIPDAALMSVAKRGELRDPAVLAREVRRMLADPRATALATNFTGQWLLVRNTKLLTPDSSLFPAYDDSLKEALSREVELFVGSQVHEDCSVLELLTAKDTFLNDRLAEHYGIPNVYGSHFRRVTLTDPRRFGLFGKGSVLLVTSYPHRTSPVLRGKWVLENLLGAPPPPPPPNVPALKESDAAKPTTVRERLEQHRRNPACAACHARMDPLGFALENFDAIGRWRDTDGGNAIDASSMLMDGTKVEGPIAFRTALVTKYRDEFVSTLVEKLLTYALGRGVQYYDMPAVRRIARDAAARGYRWSDIILGVVRSAPFQMNRVPVEDPPSPSAAAR
jgi:hypothetical protein